MSGDAARGRRLVLVRHGRTAWNAAGRGQGHTDVELDATGHAQSAAAAPGLAAYQPVALWSSDLARCRQTAEYVARKTGLEPVYDARLREFDLGARTGLTLDEFAAEHPDEYAAFAAGHFEAVPGGETPDRVAARMQEVLGELVGSLGQAETAVVLSHGAALKVATVTLLGWPLESASALKGLANCHHLVLEELPEAGRFRLAAYNVTA